MAPALTRWDPSSEIQSMRAFMDRLFDTPLVRSAARGGNADDFSPVTLGLDVYETPTDYVVKAAVPGVEPADVEISVEDDVLTIRGETAHREEVSDGQYLRQELRSGRFTRSLRLPPTVDAEQAKAEFEHGVLRLTLPKKAEARSRTFKITPRGVLEGEQRPEGGKQPA